MNDGFTDQITELLYDPAEERAVRRDLIAENIYARAFAASFPHPQATPEALQHHAPNLARMAYDAAEILMAEGDRRRNPTPNN